MSQYGANDGGGQCVLSVLMDAVQYVKTGGISTEQTAILAAGVLVSGLLVGGFLQKKGRILLAVLFAFGFSRAIPSWESSGKSYGVGVADRNHGTSGNADCAAGKTKADKIFRNGKRNADRNRGACICRKCVYSGTVATNNFSAGQPKTKTRIRRIVAGYRKKYQSEWKDRYCSRRY